MAVDYAIDTGIHAKYFTVDETFGVAFLCVLLDLNSSQQRAIWISTIIPLQSGGESHRFRILDPVFDQVISGAHKRRRDVAAHDVDIAILGMANRDVAVGVNHAMMMKYVVCRY